MSQTKKIALVAGLIVILGASAYPALNLYAKYSAKHDLQTMGVSYSEQQFIDHACAGDEGTSLLFLKAGMNINVTAISSKHGMTAVTALECATMTGHLQLATYLVNRGAGVDVADSGLNTPLIYLTRYAYNTQDTPDRLKLAELLVAKGAKVNAVGKLGTPLSGAMQSRSTEMAKFLLGHGANVNIASPDGMTPLMRLAESSSGYKPNDNLDMMKTLVEAGADVNAVSKTGLTALAIAIQRRNKDMAVYLLSKGANPNIPGGDASRMLSSALSQPDILQLLLDNGIDVNSQINNKPMLNYFIDNNNALGIQSLLAHHDLNVNIADSRGDTPLHIAAFRNNTQLIQQLISRGANINAKNFSLQTPLIKAVMNRGTEAVDELIRDGADINARDASGHTALFYANQGGRINLPPGYFSNAPGVHLPIPSQNTNKSMVSNLRNHGARE